MINESQNAARFIIADGLGKTFCRDLRRSLAYGVIDVMRELAGMPSAATGNRKGEFFAVRDLSFAVERGECLGVIGPNGAGKTTLLRLINGLIKPDQGVLRVRGRVGGLIALGAGFNPVLTGRENIYINAAVLGLGKRQTDEVLEDIIDFSEIREFIDAPVQSYSSGMLVRLGFSVAVHLDPDVLLIDEVLAVGDAGFRGKCYNKVDEIRGDKAVLLVSHNMEHIGRVCDRVLVLERGRPAFLGEAGKGIAKYRQICGSDEQGFVHCFGPIRSCHVLIDETEVGFAQPLMFRVETLCREPISVVPRLVVWDAQSTVVAEGNSRVNEIRPVELQAGLSTLQIEMPSLPLRPGDYAISVNLYDTSDKLIVQGFRCLNLTVTGVGIGEAPVQLQLRARLAAASSEVGFDSSKH